MFLCYVLMSFEIILMFLPACNSFNEDKKSSCKPYLRCYCWNSLHPPIKSHTAETVFHNRHLSKIDSCGKMLNKLNRKLRENPQEFVIFLNLYIAFYIGYWFIVDQVHSMKYCGFEQQLFQIIISKFPLLKWVQFSHIVIAV